nr:MAG TPA: hypothetical protein [Caudoviricetes sp.]
MSRWFFSSFKLSLNNGLREIHLLLPLDKLNFYTVFIAFFYLFFDYEILLFISFFTVFFFFCCQNVAMTFIKNS